jgi:hypothetical protein
MVFSSSWPLEVLLVLQLFQLGLQNLLHRFTLVNVPGGTMLLAHTLQIQKVMSAIATSNALALWWGQDAWKAQYEATIKEPWLFGMGGPQEPLHPAFQLAADETPVMYIPEVRGTYEFKNTKQIQLTGSRERRMITGTPVINRQGELVLMQLLWKGKTSQVCLSHLSNLFPLHFFPSATLNIPNCHQTCTTATAKKRCRQQ